MKRYTIELEESEILLLQELVFDINPQRYADWKTDSGESVTEDYFDNLENKIREARYNS